MIIGNSFLSASSRTIIFLFTASTLFQKTVFDVSALNSGKSEPTHYMHALHLMTQLEAIPLILVNTKEQAARFEI